MTARNPSPPCKLVTMSSRRALIREALQELFPDGLTDDAPVRRVKQLMEAA